MKNRMRLPLAVQILACVTCLQMSVPSWAGDIEISGLTIQKIRAVGDYHNTTYSSTIELWFTTQLPLPSGYGCTSTYRVYIDAKHKHLVAAAYLAFASGRKVNISVDETLPNRGGACELNYLDVLT